MRSRAGAGQEIAREGAPKAPTAELLLSKHRNGISRHSEILFGCSRLSFVGCTLWTDYRLLGTPKPSIIVAGQELNDHRLIRYREESGHYSRFMPWHAAAEHRLDLPIDRSESGKPHEGPTAW